MAFINDRWLDREEREARIKLVAERVKKLYELHKAGKATEYHIDTLLRDKAELIKLKRVHRAEVDSAYFAYEYLSDSSNSENEDNIIRNDDNGIPHEPLERIAPIHKEFFDLIDTVTTKERSANLAVAAPRGHSKSGMFSNCLPLMEVAFRSRNYILIISETDTLSKKLISWINKQLKHNKKLREDFGVLMHEASNKNEKDNEEAFITTTNALIEASSSGKALRGKRHGAYRPDLVIVDDPSSINNEGTKEAREKLIEWFNSVVVPIGSKSTATVVVGTMVSSTGLLNHVLKRKDFRPCLYDSITSEPDNPSLWDEYNEVYARAESMDEVDEFYNANYKALESGIEVAWSWRWTYRELMHKLVNMGRKSFNSEFRNRAYSEDEQLFFPENFAYYSYRTNDAGYRSIMYEGREYKLTDMTISGAWDIAMGKNARSCYNACLIVGRHEKTGHIFVLDEYASKEQAHIFMTKIIERIKQYKPHIFSVETINAQHEFYRQLQERLRIEGIYGTRVNDVKGHRASKEQRIESLEPLCANKTLIFNQNHKILLDQLGQYPHGDYVDSIDSLQMAVEHVVRPKSKIQTKPVWL